MSRRHHFLNSVCLRVSFGGYCWWVRMTLGPSWLDRRRPSRCPALRMVHQQPQHGTPQIATALRADNLPEMPTRRASPAITTRLIFIFTASPGCTLRIRAVDLYLRRSRNIKEALLKSFIIEALATMLQPASLGIQLYICGEVRVSLLRTLPNSIGLQIQEPCRPWRDLVLYMF